MSNALALAPALAPATTRTVPIAGVFFCVFLGPFWYNVSGACADRCLPLTVGIPFCRYAREGIDWVDVKYFDNKGICEMVEEKNGIIAILDDHANRPDGGDAACLSHLTQTLNANDRFSSFSKDEKSGCKRDQDFKIKHFAGDVIYTINGFVEKNSDTLFQDLKRMLYQCKMTALQSMFPEGADELSKVHKNPATAATNFKSSMLDLVGLLEKKNPYYVRCKYGNFDILGPFLADFRALYHRPLAFEIRYIAPMFIEC